MQWSPISLPIFVPWHWNLNTLGRMIWQYVKGRIQKNCNFFETQQFRDESVSLPEKIIGIRIKNTKYFSLVCGAHVPVHFLWILMSKLLLKLLTREFLDPKTELLVARITPWKTFSNVHLSTSHLNCLSITSRAKFKIGTPTINRRKLK